MKIFLIIIFYLESLNCISELMSSLKKRVSEDRSVWERLLSFFPDYRGYKDKELLRETDKLVREGIFIRVHYTWSRHRSP